MGSVERIKHVATRVAKWHRAGHRLVVVPSAMSGETNRLIGLAREIHALPDPRELDMLACTGEQVSVGLLAIALKAIGVDAVSYAGWQVPIRTDDAYTKARITGIDTDKVNADLDEGRVVVITGFQGVDSRGNVTTLGRGGSDTSAVAVAAALKADECLIYTDVDGVYTTDPRIVTEARRLDRITFEEMLEMASLGSKVLQIRSVEFAGKSSGAWAKSRIRSTTRAQDPGRIDSSKGINSMRIRFRKNLRSRLLGSSIQDSPHAIACSCSSNRGIVSSGRMRIRPLRLAASGMPRKPSIPVPRIKLMKNVSAWSSA